MDMKGHQNNLVGVVVAVIMSDFLLFGWLMARRSCVNIPITVEMSRTKFVLASIGEFRDRLICIGA